MIRLPSWSHQGLFPYFAISSSWGWFPSSSSQSIWSPSISKHDVSLIHIQGIFNIFIHNFIIYFFNLFLETVFLYVAQGDPELAAILLLQPPECWDYRPAPPKKKKALCFIHECILKINPEKLFLERLDLNYNYNWFLLNYIFCLSQL